jgi:nicotinate-nucleotide pyrophosphorylase (carboxylating)
MEALLPGEIRQAVAAALAEDVGTGDATTIALVPEGVRTTAAVVAREALVVCGLAFAEEAFRQCSEHIHLAPASRDGLAAGAGTEILKLSGPAAPILTAERVALNFLQRLSGVATATRRFVDAVAGTKACILDTRKTTPGWRRFEKYAVACGGGRNHRVGLYDMVLIKDNHLAALRSEHPNPIAAAVRRARGHFPQLRVEVEADTLDQARQALDAGADIILLDNMTCDQMREAVRMAAGRALLEASGGVNLDTVRSIAETGVDYISAGAVTHSARAVDLGLDFRT